MMFVTLWVAEMAHGKLAVAPRGNGAGEQMEHGWDGLLHDGDNDGVGQDRGLRPGTQSMTKRLSSDFKGRKLAMLSQQLTSKMYCI